MERVVVTPEADGIATMLAELVRQNIETYPDRAKLLDGVRGAVNVNATDAEVTAGLVFGSGRLTVGMAAAKPALTIACDSATLMEMSTVPLWLGRPDVRTAEGRALIGRILKGEIKVRGMMAHPILLTRLQKLLSVV